jgi:hypothetical protein
MPAPTARRGRRSATEIGRTFAESQRLIAGHERMLAEGRRLNMEYNRLITAARRLKNSLKQFNVANMPSRGQRTAAVASGRINSLKAGEAQRIANLERRRVRSRIQANSAGRGPQSNPVERRLFS